MDRNLQLLGLEHVKELGGVLLQTGSRRYVDIDDRSHQSNALGGEAEDVDGVHGARLYC